MEHGNSESTELQQVRIDAPIALSEETDSSPQRQFSCSNNCSFSNQKYKKSDAADRSKTIVKFSWLIIIYTTVMIIEIVGGLRSNSKAILADAAHMLTDIVGFSISLVTVWASGWKATPQQSFGFNRLEVIGAFVSVLLTWFISGSLIYEASKRLISKQTKVNGKLMFGISAFGFIVNLLLVLWLGPNHNHSHQDHSHIHETKESCAGEEERDKLASTSHGKIQKLNINIQGAYLHSVTDLIQSAGVMIAGFIIWQNPKWLVADLVCTLIFSIFALYNTRSMLWNVFCVLMDSAPREVDIARLENCLKGISGVCDVHDLHVWAITMGKHVLMCHVVVGPEVCSNKILHQIRDYCEKTFGIHHVTIQIEQEL